MKLLIIKISLFCISLSVILTGAAYAVVPICPHVIGWNSEINTWAQGAPWIKVIYSSDIPPAKATGAKVFYRPWDADSTYHDDGWLPYSRTGSQYADMVWSKINNMSAKPDAVGYRNEFSWADTNAAKYTSREFRNYRDRLRTLGYQGKVVFGSFGVGWVDSSVWDDVDIKDACAAADAIETHEYFDLTVNCCAPWLCYRHRDLAINAHPDHLGNKEWFIGEFGSDHVCGHCTNCDDPLCRGGWRQNNKLTAEAYIQQLDIYSKNCHPNVTAVFLFQQGAWGWADFEVMGTPVAGWMQTTWTVQGSSGSVSGNVKSVRGTPLSFAAVTAECSGANTMTDYYGNYTLTSVPAGQCTIRATKLGYIDGISVVTIVKDTVVTADFTLSPTYPGSFSGKVKRADGVGLSGASIVLTPGGASAMTNASGDYSIGNLVPGGYKLTASKSGFVDLDKTGNTTSNNNTVVDFTLNATPTAMTTISQAKGRPDGTSVSLANKAVTASSGSAFWIEESDRTSGIKAAASNSLAAGANVTVLGTLATLNSERVLNYAQFSNSGTLPVPSPLGISNSALGGIPLWGSQGPVNVGLLVKVWGRVTRSYTDHFFIDDGSFRSDFPGETGLKVWSRTLTEPAVTKYVVVTGVVTTENTNGRDVPILMPRTQADIKIF